ncbi:hypothetical protein AB4059_09000 [Lysobacter sp. 2RAF19]
MNNKMTRDEVLDAFGAAVAWPTEALVRAWAKKYPEYERDLVDFATAWAATVGFPLEALDPQREDEIVNRTMSRVQMLVREQDEATQAPPPVAVAVAANRLQIDSLEQALRAHGVTSSWIEALGIDEFILALLEEHMIAPPVPRRLLDALSRPLGVHIEVVRAWLFQDSIPQMVSYSTKKPAFERWTFQQAVQQSSLPDALKQQWLRETSDP